MIKNQRNFDKIMSNFVFSIVPADSQDLLTKQHITIKYLIQAAP